MTKKKRLFLLKKELKQLQRLMLRHNKYANIHNIDKKTVSDYNFGIYSSYNIITNDGNYYTIDSEDINFPNIDFTKIIYIRGTIKEQYTRNKVNNKIYKVSVNYSNYDSEIGFFNISDNYSYFEYIDNKYKVSNYE